jgi:hypothetical protein
MYVAWMRPPPSHVNMSVITTRAKWTEGFFDRLQPHAEGEGGLGEVGVLATVQHDAEGSKCPPGPQADDSRRR